MATMMQPQLGQLGRPPQDDEEQRQMMMAMLAAQQQPAVSSQFQDTQAQQPLSMPSQSDVQLPPARQPDVNLAHASIADQPATADVSRAQGRLDQLQGRPLWKKALPIAIMGAAGAAGAHSWGGRQLGEQTGQAIQNYVGTMRGEKESLVKQLEFAKQQQLSQYEADQRNRQQDILMAGNNQTKTLIGQMAAGSRERVADIRGGAATDVQQLRNEGGLDVQGLRNTGAENVANIRGGFDIEKTKINATAALNRFLAGQNREDTRQARGFAHTDTKPTSDEERRADLAEAASGYADMLVDIATRRPELFGPLAGRITQGKQWLGSSDPDVAHLKFLREQVGITQMGAHSLRSSQAIGSIADSLVNSFHDDAATIIANAQMAKKGLAQFISGPVRPTIYEPNPAAAPPPGAGPAANNRGTLKDKTASAPVTALTVPVGGVYNGHKYLGGSRTDQNNWQPVAPGATR